MPDSTNTTNGPVPAIVPREYVAQRYRAVRAHSEALAAPLSDEDQCVQSMPDASPTKWHLAHTSWFFEAVVLGPHVPEHRVFDGRYAYLFNSYYEALGPRHPRPHRGLLTRPTGAQVRDYRRHVDQAMRDFITCCDSATWARAAPLVELGLQHEQQHQELLLTDALHLLSCNPLLPAYATPAPDQPSSRDPGTLQRWVALEERIAEIGHAGEGFAFDNESPRHRRLLPACEISNQLVRCGDYLRFIEDGGYQRPALWLSEGWAAVQSQGWMAPPYWIAPGDRRAPAAYWQVFGLHGVRTLDPDAPVAQLSFYEAAAYAEWAGARLPTEFEWEAASTLDGMQDMQGQVWQWTRSAYEPYPGFRPLAGAVGEYNGKFMVGQIVLRGSSLATPSGHARASYRNFFPPAARWQFSGLRLARDAAQ